MIRIAIHSSRDLIPYLRGLNFLCRIKHLQWDIKPAIMCLHSKLFSLHVQNVKIHSHTISFSNQRKSRHSYFQCKSQILTAVCSPGLLAPPKTNVLSWCSNRYYHSRSKLSLTDSVYNAYVQSLVNELKVIQNENSNSEKSLRAEQEQKLQLSRYHFLLSANEVISKLLEKQREILELKSLSSEEADREMKEMMQSEIQMFEKDVLELEDELIDILAGDDPADSSDIVLEVSAGVGGQEAMLFCVEVFNMYYQYGLAKGWNVSIVNKDESELGGYRKASLEISGVDVYKSMKFEAGVHRVQRVPKTEKAGRVHTSTVTVSVLPQPREIDIQIEKKDLKIETFRGSGPGGQSVNTTDSAVRITHLPTGTAVECKQERSQIKNRDYALKTLKMRLYQVQLEEELTNRQAIRKMQMGSRGRSEKIRTYNFQQDRVTDHRVKENFSNLPDFMAGGEGLDDAIESLTTDFKYQIVGSMVEEFEISLKKKNGNV